MITDMELVYLCYSLVIAWAVCGFLCSVGFMLRKRLCRQVTGLLEEACQLHSRFVRRRRRRKKTWNQVKERRSREIHCDLIRLRQVYLMLSLPEGEMVAESLIRAQECTEHERADPFERRALARAFGVWVSETFGRLPRKQERKRFLDELGSFLDRWTSEDEAP